MPAPTKRRVLTAVPPEPRNSPAWGRVRPGRRRRAGPARLDLSPDLETSVGGDRWGRPSVDGADDLAAVDALQIDARDAEIGVSELSLDYDEWDTFVRHLDCVGVSQLVRREPPSHACRYGGPM
jgi:hypothetical protein